jgi:hypothetical protein
MGQRLELQALLKTFTLNVYFQPPANVEMKYPAIVYKRARADTQFAGNKPYRYTKRYQVTLITEDPDDPIHDELASLPMCLHDRFFTANDLNHDVFNLYF